jgi:hypothetical protein
MSMVDPWERAADCERSAQVASDLTEEQLRRLRKMHFLQVNLDGCRRRRLLTAGAQAPCPRRFLPSRASVDPFAVSKMPTSAPGASCGSVVESAPGAS